MDSSDPIDLYIRQYKKVLENLIVYFKVTNLVTNTKKYDTDKIVSDISVDRHIHGDNCFSHILNGLRIKYKIPDRIIYAVIESTNDF